MKPSFTVSSQANHYIQQFINDIESNEDLSAKTLTQYASDLRHLADWYEGSWHRHQAKEVYFAPKEMTTPTLIHYREYMQKVRSLKPKTINRRLNTLKRFFEWAVQKQMVSLDVAKPLKLVPEETTSPRHMTDQEEASLITAVQNYGTTRDYNLVLLMLHTGLRTMEVCRLVKSDITIGKRSGRLLVRSGKRNKQREVPLNATIRRALEAYRPTIKSDDDPLFPSNKTGRHMGERALRHLILKYMKLANIEDISPHDLRHRFGYVMSERTPLHRLAQIMGHDSLNTTMVYVRATRSDLQGEVEKIAWQ